MDPCAQPRLFRGSPEAILVNCYWLQGQGWQLAVRVRRAGEGWDEADYHDYGHLWSDELLDVIAADLAAALGL